MQKPSPWDAGASRREGQDSEVTRGCWAERAVVAASAGEGTERVGRGPPGCVSFPATEAQCSGQRPGSIGRVGPACQRLFSWAETAHWCRSDIGQWF